MSKGYVRALVERYNNSKNVTDGDSTEHDESNGVGINGKCLRSLLEKVPDSLQFESVRSTNHSVTDNRRYGVNLSPGFKEHCPCKNGGSRSPRKLGTSRRIGRVKQLSDGCVCENGDAPSMSPAELFDSSWSESDISFDDFSDDSGSEDKLFDTFERSLDQIDIDDVPPRDKLYRIADELLKTERAYVERLHLLHQVFHFRIKLQHQQLQNNLPAEVIPQMFSNIESIFQFHHDFLLPDLEERMRNWEQNPRIGDLMKEKAPYLKIYTDYVKNFDNAMNLINVWQEKCSKFAAIIKEIQLLPACGSLSLQHHMLEPIQRVPRYELLLKDYIKVLPRDSPDLPDAQCALDLVTKAAKHSNEAMQKTEKFCKLLEIHQALRGITVDFISPTRELIREGSITKISARSGEKQLRYMFLFNDKMLICSEPLMGNFRVRSQLDVVGMQIQDAENPTFANTFYVTSHQKTIELLDHETSGDNPTWYETITKVIDELKQKQTLRNPKLDDISDLAQEAQLPDSVLGKRSPQRQEETCSRCGASFSTFRRWRHHCRACGVIICAGCSRKATLSYMENKVERVCDKCYDVIVPMPTSLSSPDGDCGESPKKRGVLQVKASDPAVLAGYLYTSCDKGKSWVKRWFAIHKNFVMYYFKTHQDVLALSSMPLPGYSVEAISAADCIDRSNAFKIHHKCNKIHYFQTDHEKHLRKWLSVLEKIVKLELPDESQRLSSQSSVSNVSNISSNSGSGDMSETAAASDVSSLHSKTSEDCKDNDSGIANSNENCSVAHSDVFEDSKD